MLICVHVVILLTNKSVYSLLGWNHRELFLVQSKHIYRSILNVHLSAVQIRHPTVCMLHEIFIVTFGEVVSGVGAS